MSLDRAKMLLEKIETLHRSISMDSDGINRIERDLMLSYIRQLYEVYLSLGEDRPAATVSRTAPSVTATPPSASVPTKAAPTPPPAPEPEPPKATPAPEPSPANEYVPPPPPPKPEPAPVTPSPAPAEQLTATSVPPSLNGLFEHKAAKELSEKLGQRPVNDLTKAMAINDRLLYANSLFQGDSRVMNNVLAELDNKSGFDAAKGVLVDLAKQYDWAAEEREEVAKSFIKLVRRRWTS